MIESAKSLLSNLCVSSSDPYMYPPQYAWDRVPIPPPQSPPFGGIHPNEIPTDNLPPLIKEAIEEVSRNIQSPQPMIVSSIYAAISAACQNGCIVSHPQGFTSPVSLYFITLADSGERKTQTDRFTGQALRAFQELQDQKIEEENKQFKSALEHWRQEKKMLYDELRRLIKKKLPTEDISKQIKTGLREPTPPKGYKLLVDNITGPTLSRVLNTHHPCTGIFSDEGLTALKAVATDNLGNLNSAWSGTTLNFDRSGGESFKVRNPRITMSLMFQPGVLEKLLRKENNLWHESGLLARTLIACPRPNAGMRKVALQEFEWPALEAFNSRIRALLEASHPAGGISNPEVLTLSSYAKHAWGEFAADVEKAQLSWGVLSDVKAFASKIAENALRMAALNQRMESDDLEINPKNMHRAIAVCGWYLDEFKRLFGEGSQRPEELVVADTIYQWLWKKCLVRGAPYEIPKGYVRKNCPDPLRNSAILEAAYHTLAMQGKLRLETRNRTHLIVLEREHLASPLATGYFGRI